MKTISVDHLARVEGNGGISVTIDGKFVTDVKLSIYEGPRLIERLIVGKTPEEVVSIVPRICAICSISHKYAALRAMENALSIKVPAIVSLLRELMHLGEMIESHSLHIYYLALPDYVGFPNAIAMASKFDLEVQIALEMKEYGNHIMEKVSGRYIHGENPVIGGFGKFPTEEELMWIKSRAIQFMPFVLKTASLFCELEFPDCPEGDTVYACCYPRQKRYGLTGNEIILSTGEIINKDDYINLTNEFVVSYSFAKHSRYSGKPYSVGALARVINLGERLTANAGKMYKKYFDPRWKKNPLFNNAAQALEILFAFERIPDIVDQILKLPSVPIAAYTKMNGRGTGIIEAPRGLLIHSYEMSDGSVSHADIVTPTAQNASDIEKYCYLAAQNLLDNNQEEKIKDRMDLIVRAFDPCISCSVHMAEVKRAPDENWRMRLAEIQEKASPVFVGIGNRDRSDDGVGIELSLELKKHGVKDVWLESEVRENKTLWKDRSNRPIIFLDAVDFKEWPGKIVVLPLRHVLSHSLLSHKFLPFVSAKTSYESLKNSYVLGIQPESIEEGNEISMPVRLAIKNVLGQVIERGINVTDGAKFPNLCVNLTSNSRTKLLLSS